jgi:hypothetical protein
MRRKREANKTPVAGRLAAYDGGSFIEGIDEGIVA